MSALSLADLRGQGTDERIIQIIENNRPMLQETLQEQWTSAEEVRNYSSTHIGQGAIQSGTVGRRRIQLDMGPAPPFGPWLQPGDTWQRDQIDLDLAIRQCQARLQHLLMLQSQPGQQLQPRHPDGVNMMLGHLGGSQMQQQIAQMQMQPQPTENITSTTKNRLRELARHFKNKYLKLSSKVPIFFIFNDEHIRNDVNFKNRLTGQACQEPALPRMNTRPEKDTGSTTASGPHSLASTPGDGSIGTYGGSFKQSQENGACSLISNR